MSDIKQNLIDSNSFDFNMLKLSEEAQEVSLAVTNYYTKKEPLTNIATELADLRLRYETILKHLKLEDIYNRAYEKKVRKLEMKKLMGNLGVQLVLKLD